MHYNIQMQKKNTTKTMQEIKVDFNLILLNRGFELCHNHGDYRKII